MRWLVLALMAVALEPAPEGVDGRAVAERAEENFRGRTNYVEATMTVVSPRLPAPRAVRFHSWDDRPGRRSFIRILSPAKDAGTGFLMSHPNLWMYVPRVERTMRVPPSMMLQSWMGSDFTNDDLVRSSSELDDYDHVLLGVEGDRYVVEYRPHEDAPVVWGRIVQWIDIETGTSRHAEYYDEDGTKLRVFEMDDVREVDGRFFPYTWSMRPLHKEGHETRIEIQTIRFDEDFADSIFTTGHLKKKD
jgi:outer membrane lipoprotein-sorting protein